MYMWEVMSYAYFFQLHYSYFISEALYVNMKWIPAWLIRWKIAYPMLKATKGTIMAAKMACEVGWAINIGGGFSQASRD
jgi:hypothetical protein